MSFIDTRNQTNAETTIAAVGKSHAQQQSWLKALEQAGLRDAVQKTRRFLASEGPGTGAVDPVASPDSASTLQRNSGDAPAQNAAFTRLPQMAVSAATLPSPPEPTGIHDTPTQDSEASNILLAAPRCLDGARPNLTAEPRESEPAAVAPAATSSLMHQDWGPQKITVLQSEQGLELWIRDNTAASKDLKTRLSGIRKSMGPLGASLVRISLNGNTLLSPNPETAGQLMTKES